MIRLRARAGLTLIELILVLALLGLMAGVTGLAFGSAEPARSVDAASARIAAARRQAVLERRAVTITIPLAETVYDATALPDGRVIADPRLEIAPLIGRRMDAR